MTKQKCQAVITIERLISYTELDCKVFLRDECRGNRNRRSQQVWRMHGGDNGVCSDKEPWFSALTPGVWRPLAAADWSQLPLVSLELWIKDCDLSEEASYVIMGSIVLFSDPRPAGSRRSSDDPETRFQRIQIRNRIVQLYSTLYRVIRDRKDILCDENAAFTVKPSSLTSWGYSSHK